MNRVTLSNFDEDVRLHNIYRYMDKLYNTQREMVQQISVEHTMIPIIDDFVQRFNLTDFVVVADSGLMSAKNVALLESAGYQYILGARIRSESPTIKDWILSLDKEDGNIAEIGKNGSQRLIVSYSESRSMGCRTGIPYREGHSGDEADVPLYGEAHRGTHLHLLHRLQSL